MKCNSGAVFSISIDVTHVTVMQFLAIIKKNKDSSHIKRMKVGLPVMKHITQPFKAAASVTLDELANFSDPDDRWCHQS